MHRLSKKQWGWYDRNQQSNLKGNRAINKEKTLWRLSYDIGCAGG